MTFDHNGDSTARYELVNIQHITSGTMHVATVGVFDATLPSDHQFIMNGMKIVWGSDTVHIHIALFLYFWIASQNSIPHIAS